ncbi:FG-GAP repeat protein [bacterium]|nr:FG-GAP repeat protein [bacterium]
MIILLVIISFFVCGADVVFQLDNYNIPPDFDETWDMVIADFNGDGLADIIVGELQHWGAGGRQNLILMLLPIRSIRLALSP